MSPATFFGLGLMALVLGWTVPPLRRRWVTPWILKVLEKVLPKMSETERIALEAGTVGWDAELFSGRPDFAALLSFRGPPLREEEEAFLEGPTRDFATLVDDWEATQRGGLSKAEMEFLKSQGFLGIHISPKYGGLGFSAQAFASIVTRLTSSSIAASIPVLIPNSVGPGELLLAYGTEAQKEYFLPRLASGEEIPCFALTEPEAGSDAAAMQSRGVVTRGTYEGQEVLGIRLNWTKRYITLAPIATLVGLAFYLEDPEGLLGGERELGITCALVPAHLPGVEIGARHDPLGLPFPNGPTAGRDVFVPLDAIIGGPAMAGKGWRMLMECLAAGRGISLPSIAAAGAQVSVRVATAYATIRKQFGLSIGQFEGIQEPLARIAGRAYLIENMRRFTAQCVDAGQRPAVLSAIVKAQSTELVRQSVLDCMDVLGGAGICLGPKNPIAKAYFSAPIGITVEGANILTRTLIIYGQGAIRCHPFVRDQLEAVAEKDLERLDQAFFGHVASVFRNFASAGIQAWLPKRPGGSSPESRQGLSGLAHASAVFATLSDLCMASLGGRLKFRQSLTGRLADALTWMSFLSASLWRFEADGAPEAQRPALAWVVETSLYEIQEAHLGVLQNLEIPVLPRLLELFLFGARRVRPASDRAGRSLARAVLEDPALRELLSPEVEVPEGSPLARLEAALEVVQEGISVERKLRLLVLEGELEKSPRATLAARAHQAEKISRDELEALQRAQEAAREAIEVDVFGSDPQS